LFNSLFCLREIRKIAALREQVLASPNLKPDNDFHCHSLEYFAETQDWLAGKQLFEEYEKSIEGNEAQGEMVYVRMVAFLSWNREYDEIEKLLQKLLKKNVVLPRLIMNCLRRHLIREDHDIDLLYKYQDMIDEYGLLPEIQKNEVYSLIYKALLYLKEKPPMPPFVHHEITNADEDVDVKSGRI